MISRERKKSGAVGGRPDVRVYRVVPLGGTPEDKIYRLVLSHQRWLNSKGRYGKQLDKEELDFRCLFLPGIDLSYARIPYARFRGGSVRGGRFVGAYMPHSTFDGCDVAEADFTEADLRWCVFETNHEQACFDRANTYQVAYTVVEGAKNRFAYIMSFITETPGLVP